MTLHIFITACEPSADAIGAHIIHALRLHTQQTLSFSGCGGPLMQKIGLSPLIPFKDASRFGFGDIIWPLHSIKNIPLLRSFRKKLHNHIRSHPPDIVIAIDAPSFALGNKKLIKALLPSTPHVLINPPPVWAWRSKRAKTFAHAFDLILTLLPFEPPYFQAHNASCHFIGFPAAIPTPTSPQKLKTFAKNYNILSQSTPIAYLPGSRPQEIKRLLPLFARTHARLAPHHTSLQPFIITPHHLLSHTHNLITRSWPQPLPTLIPSSQKHLLFPHTKLALVASGTAALETSVAKIPTVIAYKIHPLIGSIASLLSPLFIRTQHVGILNILAQHKNQIPPIPELIQNKCTPKNLAKTLAHLLSSPSSQADHTQKLIPLLLTKEKNPASVAARHILSLITKTP